MAEREKVLVVGSGGREQAIAHKLSQSPGVGEVYVAPGNAGTEFLNSSSSVPLSNLELPNDDVGDVVDIAKQKGIFMVVVGPEGWLDKELGDVLYEEGISAIAPLREQAMLELDKAYTRIKGTEWGVPQPDYKVCDTVHDALDFAQQHYSSDNQEVVVKVAGPALGKGVVVCDTFEDIEKAIKDAPGNFGSAADKLIIEERLYGTEVSYIGLSDGEVFYPFTSAMDYKRVGEGNTGPNTGGMGSIAPNPQVTQKVAGEIEDQIVKPVISGMKSEGVPYKGILYFGVMLTQRGPMLIEINARMGDPETQVQLPLLENDLYDLYNRVESGTLTSVENKVPNKKGVVVVLSSGGYPGQYEKGKEISGVADSRRGVTVYHAGTVKRNGVVCTNGGRVLGVTAVGDSIEEARDKAYAPIESEIYFDDMQYRRDIGAGVEK